MIKKKLKEKMSTVEIGKFYFAKFTQQSFMHPRWEPVEAIMGNDGNYAFNMTGMNGSLSQYDIIDFKRKPIQLPS